MVRCSAINGSLVWRDLGGGRNGSTEEEMVMAHDWAQDVKKYASSPDEAAIKGIVKHLGIALKKRDSSLVACHDKSERNRVRDHFLKTKLALAGSDADLDKAIMEVCDKMKADRDKSRVTFYYLLAEKYDKLALFH
jgi:hypothetical protein